ncbi:MAG: DUF2252 domain-containing protein [Bacteroidia bacterium]|nr:DUF2252 domain-containing protein [Bacteroidia bacterium]
MPTPRSLSHPVRNEDYTFHPSQLSEKERAAYVIEALLSYNEGIISNNPDGAERKFDKLTQSPFVFLRGTADLMYRDFYGTDADKSIVLCIGDVHLDNYGVMETDEGSLIWGLNDFDESNFAPFTWDVKRGAISCYLSALEAGMKKKDAKEITENFVEAYLKTIRKSNEKENFELTFDKKNSPGVIKKVLAKSADIKAKKFIQQKFLDANSPIPRFKNTDEVERIGENNPKLFADVQASLNNYLKSLPTPPDSLVVLDLATKTGSGTGSIGLWRYYALVEILRGGKSEMLVLELKQERASVLSPYIGGGLLNFATEGSRVAYAENVHLPNANPWYGYTNIRELSYLVRKRSPHKMRVDLATLKKEDDFSSYAKACGKALAVAHLQVDTALIEVYSDIARSILHSINPESFSEDISNFAYKMAEQLRQDWKSFKKAHKQGKFNFTASQ